MTAAPLPLHADDDTIRAALADAHIPSLMAALVHLTGDTSHLRDDLRPESALFIGDPQGGIPEAEQARIRELALEALQRYRDEGAALPPSPSPEAVRKILDFMVGHEVPENYVEFLMAELSMDGEDPYAQPLISEIPEGAKSGFRVLVIGAGMSGLLAGIRLKEAGIPFTIVEKNADVGGTWYENRYPGCRVDSPNHVYSYSFRPQDWPNHFSPQEVLRRYFDEAATDYHLRDHIRFQTEVQTARYDERSGRWRVEVTLADGGTDTLEVNAIVSAVGQLNRPKLPEIPGRESFAGPAFHSAIWEGQHDLQGKRIGVIGTGASAFQLVPCIASDAREVTIFQRTAPWCVPNPDYMQPVPDGKHWLLNHVPFYAKWFRFQMFWTTAEGLLAAVRVDPDWNKPEQSVSAENEQLRELLLANLAETIGDDPELIARCTPNYPPGAKRALIDDGTWLRTLTREDVTLTTDPIREITPTGVVTEGGTSYAFDVLIYATGFSASRFLHPMKVFGRGGAELHDVWDGEPRAYKGISYPGFPNLFYCYGPNTNIVVNGSIIFFSECEVRYILGCIALLLRDGHKAMEPRRPVHDAYNQKIDAGNAAMAWGASNVSTWYKNERGHITQNWPFTMVEFWEQSRKPDPDDYDFS